MTGTNFRYGLFTMGVPVMPEIYGIITGQIYFVDPLNGGDSANGLTKDTPLRSVETAYNKCRDGYNDGVVILSRGGNTSSDVTTYFTSTFTWAKSSTHLIGLAAPTGISPRARLAASTTQTAAINPLFTISGSDCVFANFQVFNGIDAAVAANGVRVTGQRNYFYRVDFVGMGDPSGDNDVANGYSLAIVGGGENTFDACKIGTETSPKGSAANSEIRFESATARNRFNDCRIMTFASAATHQYIIVPSGGLEGSTQFHNCTFTNKIEGGSTVMTEAFDVNATQNGAIYLTGSSATDAGDWQGTPNGHVRQNLVGSDPGIIGTVA